MRDSLAMLRAARTALGRGPLALLALVIIASAAHAGCGGSTETATGSDAASDSPADTRDGMSYADTSYDH